MFTLYLVLHSCGLSDSRLVFMSGIVKFKYARNSLKAAGSDKDVSGLF